MWSIELLDSYRATLCSRTFACAVKRDWGFFRCRSVERGGEWQGSWIVMANSCSLTKRLSVRQQPGTAALPLSAHTNTYLYISTTQYSCARTAPANTPPLHLAPLGLLQMQGQTLPWYVPITHVFAPFPPGQDPRWIWKHLPHVNIERDPESKSYKRWWLRQNQQKNSYSLLYVFLTFWVRLCLTFFKFNNPQRTLKFYYKVP